MAKSTSIPYRRHSIRIISKDDGYQARAIRKNRVVGETCSGDTLDAAVLAVKQVLDEHAAKLRAKRAPHGFPCADEIRAALACVPMNKAREAMLIAHLKAPDHIMTATELAKAAGYENYSVANLQYGQLAFDLAKELEWTPEEAENGVTIWTFTLAEDADKQARGAGPEVLGQWRWKLRPEIVEALS